MLELPHPLDNFDASAVEGDAWDAPQPNGTTLLVEFGTADDPFNPLTQVS